MIGALLVLAALLAAAVAYAGGHEQIKYKAADQTAARAATLKRTDLTSATGWTGGSTKPDISAPPSCRNYQVDLSKYVLTGAARTQWSAGTRQVSSQVEVLQTAQMVAAEWRLQIVKPGAIACLRSVLAKSFTTAGGSLVSFKKVSFPKLATYVAAFRLVAVVGGQNFKIAVNVVLIGKGRTEVELTVSDLVAAQSAVATDALHYARILAARVKS